MEKRTSNRIPFCLDAKIVSKDVMYNGVIENVSEDGIEYLMTAYVESTADFMPQRVIDLNFRAPSGDSFHLKCEVKWYLETAPHEKNLLLGMRILSPPPAYKHLVKALSGNR